MALNLLYLAEPSVGSSQSLRCWSNLTDLSEDTSEPPRVDFVEGANFAPSNKPSFSAGKTALWQLATYLPEPANMIVNRGGGRVADRRTLGSEQRLEAQRDVELLDPNSRSLLGNFLAYDALQTSNDSKIEKNIDSVGAECSRHADGNKSLTRQSEAIEEGLDGVIPNDTFTLINKLPEGRNPIT